MAQQDKRGKYARELEKIKKMRALNNMLSKGDIENALLASGSKESEHTDDNLVDSMLDRVQQKERSGKDMEMVDKLTEISTRQGVTSKRLVARKHPASRKAAPHKPKLWKMLKLKRHAAKKARKRH
jgi:hypothetical protein